jgi:hypothetical protein
MCAARSHDRFWGVLSLWALLALTTPQLLWACPMTGQVGSTPPTTCRCATPVEDASASNSAAHKCCHRVPLPASDTAGHDQKGLIAGAKTITFAFQPFTVAGDLFAVSAFELALPAAPIRAALPTISPPLISQQLPAAHFGRAPPL